MMKNLILFFAAMAVLTLSNCSKDNGNDVFDLLTGPTWAADSLLVNGVDASGPGQFLEQFKGNAKFNTDGTGTFGAYSGTWWFHDKSKPTVMIKTETIPLPLMANIVELTEKSLKITMQFMDETGVLNIRMTFKAK